MVKLSAEETLSFDFRSRVSFAFHQNIQRCFVVFSTYPEQQEISQTVELEQSRQHRVILRELIAELDAVAAYFGENFEDVVLGNLVVNDELDYLAKMNEELTIALRNWHLMESITFSSPRMLSVHFAGWLQVTPFSISNLLTFQVTLFFFNLYVILLLFRMYVLSPCHCRSMKQR